MGFYPVTVGRPVYDIGSPLFRQVRISLANGKTFSITARNTSEKNKYVQSATLNGKQLNSPFFTHSDLWAGGSVVLVMGPAPNRNWGTTPP
jgi:putative alpha-1,2-mannosidase